MAIDAKEISILVFPESFLSEQSTFLCRDTVIVRNHCYKTIVRNRVLKCDISGAGIRCWRLRNLVSETKSLRQSPRNKNHGVKHSLWGKKIQSSCVELPLVLSNIYESDAIIHFLNTSSSIMFSPTPWSNIYIFCIFSLPCATCFFPSSLLALSTTL